MANVPSSPILVTLMMETLHSSETSVFTRATWLDITEDDILQTKPASSVFKVEVNQTGNKYYGEDMTGTDAVSEAMETSGHGILF
jgi:hypothetical protein